MFKQLLCISALICNLFIPFNASAFDNNEKVTYSFIDEPIDVVIPSTAKDNAMLEYCIESVKKYCNNIRRIIVVSPQQITYNAEWFDEASYPFSKHEVALHLNGLDEDKATNYMKQNNSRVGWYYQQLLKLYAPSVIPGISSNALIVDSDVVFFHPVNFINSEGGGNYAYGTHHHQPYFAHANRLLPGLRKLYNDKSGICHHMLFQKAILDDLFFQVEEVHHQEFWKAFLLCVDPAEIRDSGASEYEIYFNFAFSRTQQVTMRPLSWYNWGKLHDLQHHKNGEYDFVSYHSYYR